MMKMMKAKCSRQLLLSIAFLLLIVHLQAQVLEDSLRKVVNQKSLSFGERVYAMDRLGQVVFFNKSWEEGIQLLKQSLDMSVSVKEGMYRARTWSILAMSYKIMGDEEHSAKSLDSALAYYKRTSNKTVKGYVLYSKGWIESRNHQEPTAIRSFQQALDMMEQQADALKYIQSVYSEMSGVYFRWCDLVNVEKYTRLSLETANQLGLLERLIPANQERGSYFINLFRNEASNKMALDSGLYYMRHALQIARANRERLVNPSDIPFAAIGISSVFLDHFPATKAYQDSIQYYNEIALEESRRTKQYTIEAGVYNTLASIAYNNKDYDAALNYANGAILVSMQDPMMDKYNLSQSYLALSEAYEKKADTALALHHYKQYMMLYKELFDADKMSQTKELEARYEITKKEKALLEVRLLAEQQNRQLMQARYLSSHKDQALLEARFAATLKDKALLAAEFKTEQKQQALTTANYRTAKREQELKAMEERMIFNRKMNKIYSALTVALLLAAGFFYYAYKQRTRSLQQARQLHEMEVDKMKQENKISTLSAMLEGQEQERTRLARDLHDGLGGMLSGVKIQLSALSPLAQEPKQQHIVSKTLDHLDGAVDELRRIAKSMMPEVLLSYGLGEATKEYCNGLRSTGIPVACQVYKYKNDMEHGRQVTLYRIMQELVNNAVKHAAASQILVQLQQSGDQIFLTVEDDGKGIAQQDLEHLKGAGIANIRSRVEMLQGKMDIQTDSQTGTTFTIECAVKNNLVL